MQAKQRDNLIITCLFPNEEVLPALKTVCKNFDVKTAIVISAVGQLYKVSLGYFKKKGDYLVQLFEEPFELLSLSGIISKNKQADYDFHLHSVFGGKNKEVIGGHFIGGKVKITAEIVLLKSNLEIERKENQETGLKDLFLRESR